jgi:hypothetical protein
MLAESSRYTQRRQARGREGDASVRRALGRVLCSARSDAQREPDPEKGGGLGVEGSSHATRDVPNPPRLIPYLLVPGFVRLRDDSQPDAGHISSPMVVTL